MGYYDYDGGGYYGGGGDYYGGGGDYYGGYYGGGYYDGYYAGYYDDYYGGYYAGPTPTHYVPVPDPDPHPTTGGGYYISDDGTPTVGVPGERPDDDPPDPWWPPPDYYAYYGYRGGGGYGGGGAGADSDEGAKVHVLLTEDGYKLTVDGFSFAFLISAKEWDQLGKTEQEHLKAALTHNERAPEFHKALEHLEKEGVRNIILRYDDKVHKYDGTTRDWNNREDERGTNEYVSLSDDGTDIKAGTDLLININQITEDKKEEITSTFIHELFHPYISGIQETSNDDEDDVAKATKRAYEAIF